MTAAYLAMTLLGCVDANPIWSKQYEGNWFGTFETTVNCGGDDFVSSIDAAVGVVEVDFDYLVWGICTQDAVAVFPVDDHLEIAYNTECSPVSVDGVTTMYMYDVNGRGKKLGHDLMRWTYSAALDVDLGTDYVECEVLATAPLMIRQ